METHRKQKNETKFNIEKCKKNQKTKLLLIKHFSAIDNYGSFENYGNLNMDSLHKRDVQYLVDKPIFEIYQQICNLLSNRYYLKLELSKHRQNIQQEQQKERKMSIERNKLLRQFYIPGLPNHYANKQIDTLKITIKEVEKQIKLTTHKLKTYLKKLDGILLPQWTTTILKHEFKLMGSYIGMQQKKYKLNNLSCKIEVCNELLQK